MKAVARKTVERDGARGLGWWSGSESNRGVAAEQKQLRLLVEGIQNETMDVRDDVCVREAGGEEGGKRAGVGWGCSSHNDVRVSPPVANSNKEELHPDPV